uniref:Uncharacterized protein n=1 Tax=Dulem virus 38 TaxID=3145756 RepID=A0AAU8B133_9CAUD
MRAHAPEGGLRGEVAGTANLGVSWERHVAPVTAHTYIYGSPSLTGRGSLLENM